MHSMIFTDTNGAIGLGRSAGAYRLATEFRKRGKYVKVIDFMQSFKIDEIREIILRNKTKETEWIGFSSTFIAPKDFNPAESRIKIKKELENATSVGLERGVAEKLFDFIRSLGLKVLIGGSRIKYDFNDVSFINGPAESKFFPDFDFTTSTIDWQEDDYLFENEHLPIEIARGCIFKCSFCSYPLNGKKLWEFCKSPEVLRDEMLRNYDMFGTTGYMFSDDTYNDSPDKVYKLNNMFSKLPFKLEFTTYARADLIISKPETWSAMYESGLRSVFFGIESLNHQSAKSVGKGMHPDKIKEGLIWMKEKHPDVHITCGFISGLPYETEESLLETMHWLETEKCVNSYSFQVLSISQKSKIGLDPDKYGYDFDANGNWTNPYLNQKRAEEIAQMSFKSPLTGFTFYNRLRNLDYSAKEVDTIGEKNMNEITHRYINKVEKYKDDILN